MGVSPPGGGVPDSGAKLVRLRRYRSVSISPSSGAENGGQDGPSATYVLPKLAFAGKHCGEFLDKRNTINATVAAPRRVRRPGDIICPNPNCRSEGPPRKVARGSILVGVVLLLFFILPGILYFIFMQGYRYDCPKCGLQIRSVPQHDQPLRPAVHWALAIMLTVAAVGYVLGVLGIQD